MSVLAPCVVASVRYLRGWVIPTGFVALCLVGWGLATPAAAQVTNQSDVTGATPDIIYPIPVDFLGLASENPELAIAATELADQIGETQAACLALSDENAPPVARSIPATACEDLEALLEQARTLLAAADTYTQEQVEQMRDRQLW